jgi:type II secretory ATPase GspE/PulE/Tfp pilus assembly ATPase PilB-like protein
VSDLPPDRTSRLSRTQGGLFASSRAGAPRFPWPAPPYWEFAEKPSERPPAEECLLSFKDGEKASGLLLDFLPDAETLKFRQAKARGSVTVSFADLQGVHLLRPVKMHRQLVSLDATQMFDASDRQSFSVQLASGASFEGETVGHVHALCGLFLYLPEADASVIRCFVPARAALDSRIGKPLGEMLIDENLASADAVGAALEKQKSLRTRKLGEYLTANQIVSPEQLAAALKHQSAQPVQKLGETLVELGYLTDAELQEALAIEARDRSVPLGQILADMGVLDAEVVNGVMARKLGIPFVNLKSFRVAPAVLKRLPAAVAHRYQVLPLSEADNALVVALENPMNMEKMDELRFVAGTKLVPVMAGAQDLRDALERYYGQARDPELAARRAGIDVAVGELTHRLASESGETDAQESQAVEIDSTLVKLVNKLIVDAAEQKASDIHIECNPAGKDLRVRFRKDGGLVTYLELPYRFRSAIVSRLKIMAQLDITERRKPQDGKIEFKRFGPLDIDLRVASIPTANGLEDIVIRVLGSAALLPVDKLGFDTGTLEAIKRLVSRPHGLLLVCGPTGSGKTTTLHSLLGVLNTTGLKIWTAEDPIEITQPGLRQVQVHPKIGWTFAAAMRSFMRADPDVIMVGEVRDAETCRIAIEASLTGHIVFSTLHTNSAAESVVRLLDLGMDPFNFADALLGVLAQRLVRTLCESCRERYQPDAKELGRLAVEYCGETPLDAAKLLEEWRAQGKLVLYRAKGCKECDRTGYKGRIAVFELLVADPALKRLIQSRAPVSEVAATAMANGMRTLKQDGIAKVLEGFTDLQQIRGV